MKSRGFHLRLLRSCSAKVLNPNSSSSPLDGLNLSAVLGCIQQHDLLDETKWDEDERGSEEGRKAVDAWVAGIMAMLRSKQPLSHSLAASLLGVTLRCCSLQRFICLAPTAFDRLCFLLKERTVSAPHSAAGSAAEESGMEQLQEAGDDLGLRAAACNSIIDLVVRSTELTATPPPSLPSSLPADSYRPSSLLTRKEMWRNLIGLMEGGKQAEGKYDALNLVCRILRSFPVAARGQMDRLEAAFVSVLLHPSSPPAVLQLACRCISLLPSAADAGSMAAVWSEQMRRLLLAIHVNLDAAFEGLEASSPPSLTLLSSGAHSLGHFQSAVFNADQLGAATWPLFSRLLLSLLSTLELSLTTPCNAAVPVPIHCILQLALRMLRVSPSSSLSPAVSRNQDLLLSLLSSLHSHSLSLLAALLSSCRSQLAVYGTTFASVLSQCFNSIPRNDASRVRLYQLTAHLLQSMGSGLLLLIAPSLIAHATVDLGMPPPPNAASHSSALRPPYASPPTAAASQNKQQRRQALDAARGNTDRKGGKGGSAAGRSIWQQQQQLDAASQVMAALEALIRAGASLIPHRLRSFLDSLIAQVAQQSLLPPAAASTSKGPTPAAASPLSAAHITRLQLAACRALLATVLAPSFCRPPHIRTALQVFRAGSKTHGSPLAHFCSLALLSLEPLLRPRYLPPAAPVSSASTSSLASPSHLPTAAPADMTPPGAVPRQVGEVALGEGLLDVDGNAQLWEGLEDPWQMDVWQGVKKDEEDEEDEEDEGSKEGGDVRTWGNEEEEEEEEERVVFGNGVGKMGEGGRERTKEESKRKGMSAREFLEDGKVKKRKQVGGAKIEVVPAKEGGRKVDESNEVGISVANVQGAGLGLAATKASRSGMRELTSRIGEMRTRVTESNPADIDEKAKRIGEQGYIRSGGVQVGATDVTPALVRGGEEKMSGHPMEIVSVLAPSLTAIDESLKIVDEKEVNLSDLDKLGLATHVSPRHTFQSRGIQAPSDDMDYDSDGPMPEIVVGE